MQEHRDQLIATSVRSDGGQVEVAEQEKRMQEVKSRKGR
jgi:hypothetical protein